MNNHSDTDNRNLEEICKAQEDRIAAMARRIVELMAENQVLSDALAQARWSIQEASRLMQ